MDCTTKLKDAGIEQAKQALLKNLASLIKAKYSDWKNIHEPLLLDLGVEEYFSNFWADSNVVFPLNSFSESVGHYDVTLSKWAKTGHQPCEVINSGTQQKILKCTVPLEGVPFCSKTGARKIMNLVERYQDKKVVIEIDTKTIEAPYSNTFSCQECWIALGSPQLGPDKCILARLMRVHFVEFTFFKSQILGRAEEGITDVSMKWLATVKSKGLLTAKPKPLPPKKEQPPPPMKPEPQIVQEKANADEAIPAQAVSTINPEKEESFKMSLKMVEITPSFQAPNPARASADAKKEESSQATTNSNSTPGAAPASNPTSKDKACEKAPEKQLAELFNSPPSFGGIASQQIDMTLTSTAKTMATTPHTFLNTSTTSKKIDCHIIGENFDADENVTPSCFAPMTGFRSRGIRVGKSKYSDRSCSRGSSSKYLSQVTPSTSLLRIENQSSILYKEGSHSANVVSSSLQPTPDSSRLLHESRRNSLAGQTIEQRWATKPVFSSSVQEASQQAAVKREQQPHRQVAFHSTTNHNSGDSASQLERSKLFDDWNALDQLSLSIIQLNESTLNMQASKPLDPHLMKRSGMSSVTNAGSSRFSTQGLRRAAGLPDKPKQAEMKPPPPRPTYVKSKIIEQAQKAPPRYQPKPPQDQPRFTMSNGYNQMLQNFLNEGISSYEEDDNVDDVMMNHLANCRQHGLPKTTPSKTNLNDI